MNNVLNTQMWPENGPQGIAGINPNSCGSKVHLWRDKQFICYLDIQYPIIFFISIYIQIKSQVCQRNLKQNPQNNLVTGVSDSKINDPFFVFCFTAQQKVRLWRSEWQDIRCLTSL